jgi:uncharacterized protein YacL
VTRRSLLSAFAIDLTCVLVFVLIGRRQHEQGSAASEIVKTALPFLIGLVVAWLLARPMWNAPTAVRTGVVLWLVTLVVGMLLRRFAFDRGTATAFVIVATLFLALTLVGWRVATAQVRARSHARD